MRKKIISSSSLTTASTGNIGVGTGSTTTTLSTNIVPSNSIFNNYVFNGTKIIPNTFSVTFSWKNKSVDISLKEGNDVFKLATAFMNWLDSNDIEYDIKTTGRKK